MDYLELQIAISLIEGEYAPEKRNTPKKMVKLIKDEFGETVPESDIINFYNLQLDDWEREQRLIEYDFRYPEDY